MFVPDGFRGLNKKETPIAFVDPCTTCVQVAEQTEPFWESDEGAESVLNLAYYWEWAPREKVFKPCFGTIFEDHVARRNGWDQRFCRTAYYKRVPTGRDYKNFATTYDGNKPWPFRAHQYTHFNISELDAMLKNPAHLPVGTSTWAYWQAD